MSLNPITTLVRSALTTGRIANSYSFLSPVTANACTADTGCQGAPLYLKEDIPVKLLLPFPLNFRMYVFPLTTSPTLKVASNEPEPFSINAPPSRAEFLSQEEEPPLTVI